MKKNKHISIVKNGKRVFIENFKSYYIETDEDDCDDYISFINVNKSLDYFPENLINIDELILELEKIKANNNTHVNIEFHSDHEELEITPYEIRNANPSEIDDYYSEETIQKEHAKALKISLLEEELEKLKNS